MNMLEEFLNFEKNNITLFAKEILSDYYDENIFIPLLNVYVENRYYNYYSDNDLTFDENILEYLKKRFISLTEGFSEDNKDKAEENFSVFNFIMFFDGVYFLDEPAFINILEGYREKLFNIEDKVFKENITKFVHSTENKREKFYKMFESKDFYLEETPTNNDDVTDIVLRYNIEFPKIYSEYAIDRVFDSVVISEEKMFVEYQLITLKIIQDIKNCIFDRYYLIEFPTSLFENKEGLNALLSDFNNDCFKNQSVFKIKYEDYCKYGNSVKDMIKDGYLLAIELDDEEEIEDLIIFEIFKYIIVDKDSKYCKNEALNDKLIIV